MIVTRAQAHTVKRAATRLGVNLPKPFTADLDAASKLAEAADNIGDSTAALSAAVLTALAEGRDYHIDPEVARLLLDSVLVRQNNIGEAARARANQDIAATLAEHGDDILAGWADALEPHAQALAAAAAALPSDDLDDTRKVIEAGATAMTHWSGAQEALKCWQAAVDGFRSLATVARITVDKNNPLIITDADFATLEPIQTTARSNGTTVDAWTLARNGVPLRLATISTYMERAASHAQQRQAAARRAHERHEEERSVLA